MSYTQLYAHLVWTTLDREPLLTPAVAPAMHGYLSTRCAALKCTLLAVGGIADHVHALVSLHPDVAIARLARELKAPSSGFAHRALGLPSFAWQSEYGAFTLRHSDLPTVRSYIWNQEQHHLLGTVVPEWERSSASDE